MHTFHRFNKVSTSGWSYNANSWDAITWKPNKSLMLAGFGQYGFNTPQDYIGIHYKILVDNSVVVEPTEVEI